MTTTWDTSDIARGIAQARERAREAAARGLTLGAEHVLGESNEHVPHEEGTLERSGETRVDEAQLRAVIFYNTPYAVAQHEEMDYQHDAGRTAKFLENAMNGERSTTGQIIATEIRRQIEGS